jgi:DNA primase
MGNTIGFSARKWREETYGGKYINTPETALFKKSKVFFGLFYSKKRMMRDRIACIVEGQLDALRLIDAGFDFAVASLGTAFGPTHVEQLKAMGIEEVFLSFDQDEAGLASAEKAGHLLLKKGIGVRIVRFSGAKDPDELLSSQGKSAFFHALTSATDYVQFLVERAKTTAIWTSPREKDQAVRHIAERIREWENPILVHEALKQLASLADVPENVLNISQVSPTVPQIPALPQISTPHDLLLEIDLIRWLLFAGPDQPELVTYCKNSLEPKDFANSTAQKLYEKALQQIESGGYPDFMSLCSEVDLEPIAHALQTVLARRQHLEKALPSVIEAVKQLKVRSRTKAIEEIRTMMQDPSLSESQLMELTKRVADLSKNP